MARRVSFDPSKLKAPKSCSACPGLTSCKLHSKKEVHRPFKNMVERTREMKTKYKYIKFSLLGDTGKTTNGLY
jgi:hypothetical protein